LNDEAYEAFRNRRNTMNRFAGLLDGPYTTYARTLLALRVTEFRKKAGRGDIGASAIELAVITAIIAVLAMTIALLIRHVTNSQKTAINSVNNQ
jgi:Flp pilus assembly pilin Flp